MFYIILIPTFQTWCIYSCTLISCRAELLGIIIQWFNSSTGCRVYSFAWKSHFSRCRISPKVLHGDVLSNGKSKCACMTDLKLNSDVKSWESVLPQDSFLCLALEGWCLGLGVAILVKCQRQSDKPVVSLLWVAWAKPFLIILDRDCNLLSMHYLLFSNILALWWDLIALISVKMCWWCRCICDAMGTKGHSERCICTKSSPIFAFFMQWNFIIMPLRMTNC